MRFFIPLCMLLCQCSHKNFELEQMTEDVLRSKQGIEIDIQPIPKQQGKSLALMHF